MTQHANMRRKNESVLLSLIRRMPGLSSAQLARESGFAPQTVSVLLKVLEDQNIVMRGDALRGRRGQPAIPMYINPNGGFAMGIDIGWRHLDIVVVNLAGDIMCHRHEHYDYQRADGLVDRIIAAIDDVLADCVVSNMSQLNGIGIASPSYMSDYIHIFGGTKQDEQLFREVDIRAEIERRTGLPTYLQNDGTTACRAEIAAGLEASGEDCVTIFIGSLIGAGAYVDGRVIEGRMQEGSAIGGSMVPAGDGEVHALHFVASILALEEFLEARGKSLPRIPPENWDWEPLKNDIDDWMDKAAEGIAIAIANSCAVIRFSNAVIDGVLPTALLEVLVLRVRSHMARLPIVAFSPPLIRQGKTGSSAPAIGAAHIPLEHDVFSEELPDAV